MRADAAAIVFDGSSRNDRSSVDSHTNGDGPYRRPSLQGAVRFVESPGNSNVRTIVMQRILGWIKKRTPVWVVFPFFALFFMLPVVPFLLLASAPVIYVATSGRMPDLEAFGGNFNVAMVHPFMGEAGGGESVGIFDSYFEYSYVNIFTSLNRLIHFWNRF